MTRARTGDAGLSLIEVLVSLAIFAVIGVAGLAILNTVARTGERTEGRLERLAEIDRAFLIIRRDLAQIAPSEITLDGDVLVFRRANADGQVALAFRIEDTTLTRHVGDTGSGPVDQHLLSQTTAAQWRLLDGSQDWHTLWPPADGSTTGRPLAAELTLKLRRNDADMPEVVTRLFPLPAGQGR